MLAKQLCGAFHAVPAGLTRHLPVPKQTSAGFGLCFVLQQPGAAAVTADARLFNSVIPACLLIAG